MTEKNPHKNQEDNFTASGDKWGLSALLRDTPANGKSRDLNRQPSGYKSNSCPSDIIAVELFCPGLVFLDKERLHVMLTTKRTYLVAPVITLKSGYILKIINKCIIIGYGVLVQS